MADPDKDLDEEYRQAVASDEEAATEAEIDQAWAENDATDPRCN